MATQIQTRVLNGIQQRVKSARELHKLLGLKILYQRWIALKVKKLGLIESVHYLIDINVYQVSHQGGTRMVETTDYYLLSEIADMIAMSTNNIMGLKAIANTIEQKRQLQEIVSENLRYANANQKVIMLEYRTLSNFAQAHNLSYSTVCAVLRGESSNPEVTDILLNEFGIQTSREVIA